MGSAAITRRRVQQGGQVLSTTSGIMMKLQLREPAEVNRRVLAVLAFLATR
jgi:hypothetical protein